MSTKRLTGEFKSEAVRWIVEHGQSIAKVAERLRQVYRSILLNGCSMCRQENCRDNSPIGSHFDLQTHLTNSIT